MRVNKESPTRQRQAQNEFNLGLLYHKKEGEQMSDVKWIKLSVSMFDDEKIRIIESMPESDTILICWVKILSLAGKTNANGFIFISENIPYTDEMLSAVFNRPLNTVRMALDVFCKFGMIEIDEQNYISISNWSKYQSVERLEQIKEQNKIRKRRQREKEKQILLQSPHQGERKCAYCGVEATTIDHIIPQSKGGSDNFENLVDCCKSCNSSKKDKDLADFLNDAKTLYYNIDFELVLRNEKLMKFVTRDVTGHFTQVDTNSHADVTDIDKELEIDKENKNSPDAHQDHTPSENIITPSINKQKENYDIPYEEIVTYLNENTGKSYKHTTKKTRDLIKARWNEGFVLDDFKQVIDNKVSDWLRNGEMNVYLRPETLFGTKFEGYLNEKTRKQPTIHIGAHTKQNNLTIDDQWDEV